MGFTDSLKKVIGIEEINDDDIVTEEELSRAREKVSRESRTESSFAPAPVFTEEVAPAPVEEKKSYAPAAAAPAAAPASSYSRSSEKRVSVANTNSLKLILIEPKAFDECPKLVDSLKARKPVIINLERLETETARKIFDFLSGATYALNGNVQKIANNIFIFTPENVAVSASRNTVAETQPQTDKGPWR
ncbi:MAG: cell division protein SepF [Eubacterium sp.]|nr:cell division protein SepF [Eubacterium sp.]